MDELASFVFDHPVVERAEGEGPAEWYWTEDFTVEADPSGLVNLVAELFEHSGELRWKYSEEQLEQGLWFIFGAGGDEWFAPLLRDQTVTGAQRCRLVAAIHPLYAGLLSQVQLDTAPFMIWDLLIHRYYDGVADDIVVPSGIDEIMFSTLRQILALPDEECQRAALHGLGHLRHADTTRIVSEYLVGHPALSDHIAEYAARVRDGDDIL